MHLDEAHPILGHRVGSDINGVGVSCAKCYIHLAELFHACSFGFTLTNALEAKFKSKGNVEIVKKFGVLLDTLLVWDLHEVKVVSQHHVHMLIGKEYLWMHGKVLFNV